jgi:hypothetical protein
MAFFVYLFGNSIVSLSVMGCGLNTFSKKTFQKSITIFDLKTN